MEFTINSWFSHYKPDDQLKITQLVEIEMVDGQCRTSFYPPNDQLIKQAAERSTPPVMVVRYLSFPLGVPLEHAWVHPNGMQECTETIGAQRMSYERWLEIIEQERAAGTGHIGP